MFLLLSLVFAVMAIVAPRFLTVDNQIGLFKGAASIQVIPTIGFTLVLAIRQLDLSFASVMTLGGMLTLGFPPRIRVVRRAGGYHWLRSLVESKQPSP